MTPDSEQSLGHGQKDVTGQGPSLCLAVANISHSQCPGKRGERARLLAHSSWSLPSPSTRVLRTLRHKTHAEKVNNTCWLLSLSTPKWIQRASTRVRHNSSKTSWTLCAFGSDQSFKKLRERTKIKKVCDPNIFPQRSLWGLEANQGALSLTGGSTPAIGPSLAAAISQEALGKALTRQSTEDR